MATPITGNSNGGSNKGLPKQKSSASHASGFSKIVDFLKGAKKGSK